MKKAENKNALFSFCYLHVVLLYTLIYSAFTITKSWSRWYCELYLVIRSFVSLLTLSLPPDQMVSPNRNREDRANNPTQTQGLQAMVPIMVKTQQRVAEEASFSRNHNPISSHDHQIPTDLPLFDKEKILTMQARVLQERLQSKTLSSDNMEMTRAEVPTGPVKRQVAEAWNN